MLDEEPTPAVASPWYRRAGRRVVRRPVAWWRRPWTNERVVRVLVTSSVLVTSTVIMMMIVHLNPFSPSSDLVFDQTTPTGGDMGAHVWAPAYLRDHLLPHFKLSGWSMDWYGGLPIYRFYMVMPALAIVALDVILPYGVAFKLVAVSGLVLFPIACWTFGRLAAFRHPIPELFAIAGLCFLLDESYQIYGGNVKSTMAGEFSFSIALTLAMFGLGLLAAGPAHGEVPRLRGDRAVAGRRVARHRADLRRGQRDHPVPRVDRPETVRVRDHHGGHHVAAVGVVGRPVPVRPSSS